MVRLLEQKSVFVFPVCGWSAIDWKAVSLLFFLSLFFKKLTLRDMAHDCTDCVLYLLSYCCYCNAITVFDIYHRNRSDPVLCRPNRTMIRNDAWSVHIGRWRSARVYWAYLWTLPSTRVLMTTVRMVDSASPTPRASTHTQLADASLVLVSL